MPRLYRAKTKNGAILKAKAHKNANQKIAAFRGYGLLPSDIGISSNIPPATSMSPRTSQFTTLSTTVQVKELTDHEKMLMPADARSAVYTPMLKR
mmetsp:Transcript_1426/g.3940  ORF Transcript_1426/g.3940 Transcript_1426/m.3940 type:complete len:95 (+) Transcript_1426:132-416(+)